MREAGDRFPDGITLVDDEGANVHFDDVLATGPMVLFFYPADHTPGCTREACSFRDAYADFQDAGATVFGVSTDSTASHQSFRKKHALPYALLTDKDGALAKRLGVPKVLGIVGGRVTFVVAPDHTILHAFRSQVQATRHATEALEALQAAGPPPAT